MGTPKLMLGNRVPVFPLWSMPLTLKYPRFCCHMHCLGVSGTGKSKWLESIFLQLFQQRIGISFIDPHGDSADALLSYLLQLDLLEKNRSRLLYIEFQEDNYFLPWNILKQDALPHAIAGLFKEAMHRAWPALSGGAAPMFDTLIQDGVKVLISAGLPITSLYRLLTDKAYRDQLLQHERDWDVVSFFHDQYDRLSTREQVDQAGAALRRAHLLTFSPVLKYSLGQQENVLDIAQLIDSGVSVIYNLSRVQDQEVRRLLGCFLSILYEQAALSRDGTTRQRTQHHLIVDEMGEFVSQSEQGLSRILSQARKSNFFVILAHQTWSQATERLRGALQNCQISVVFGVGREDAERQARNIGRVNIERIKHEVANETALERTHPLYESVPEQWEEQIQHLVDLKPRHAVVRGRGMQPVEIKTLTMPKIRVSLEQVDKIKQYYRDKIMKRKDEIILSHHQGQSLQSHTVRSK